MQKWQIDEMRKILGEFFNRESMLVKNMQEMDNKYEAEKIFVSNNPEHSRGFGAYVKKYLEDKEKLQIKLDGLRQQIEKLQDEIADEFKKQKTYEITHKNRVDRENKEIEDKEQKAADELSLNLHRRKQTQT